MTAVGYISDKEEIAMHPGHSSNMMVRLHLNCQKDHLCPQHCLERTALEDELKSGMSAIFGKSAVNQSKVTTIAHLKAFRTLKIG
jgi:hypothetical protein